MDHILKKKYFFSIPVVNVNCQRVLSSSLFIFLDLFPLNGSNFFEYLYLYLLNCEVLNTLLTFVCLRSLNYYYYCVGPWVESFLVPFLFYCILFFGWIYPPPSFITLYSHHEWSILYASGPVSDWSGFIFLCGIFVYYKLQITISDQ